MITDPEDAARRLSAWLNEHGHRGDITRLDRAIGGAGPETWRVARRSAPPLILRTDAATPLHGANGRVEEFAALRRAWRTGLPVPRPVNVEPDGAVLGAPFSLMREVPGTVDPIASRPDGVRLARECAGVLAALHTRTLGARMDAAGGALVMARRDLAAWPVPRPALAHALAWCEAHKPLPDRTAFTHRDFRIGNIVVLNGALRAVLDWEYAGVSDPAEDLGWFCAPAWRHGRLDLEAGGLAPGEVFLRAYEKAARYDVDRERVHWWTVMGQLRWAIIALHQGRRASDGQPDVDLALTGHRLPLIERDLLNLIRPDDATAIEYAFGRLTEDHPTPSELRDIARAALPVGQDPIVLKRLADRLERLPSPSAQTAGELMARIAEGRSDGALWSVLHAEACLRAELTGPI